jgi:hypothetical protein
MTKQQKALQLLYGLGGHDLTVEGYSKRIHKLRKANPSLARWVERALEPFLADKIFPRKKVKWQETSEGTRLRLGLLPYNPYLKQDVAAIRFSLGIPEEQVKAKKNSPEWEDLKVLVKPSYIRKVLESNLVGAWHFLHCQAAVGQEALLTGQENLPPAMVESAIGSARINLKADNIPGWLQQPLAGPAPYNNLVAPVDRAAGRLVERYAVPWHAFLPLVYYILTENPEFLKDIEPFDVKISQTNTPLTAWAAFAIIIKNVDEYTRKEDWDRIWERMIKPRQEKLWELRGTKPQGRRSHDIRRLQDYLPLYNKIVVEKKTVPQVLADPEAGDREQDTVRRAMIDLSKLLKPVVRGT